MKTLEEKAKAYDEVLKQFKGFTPDDRGLVLVCPSDVFPELKESEDEKIRKALIEMVHDTTGDSLWIDYNVHKENALSWLEKQGEQKPQRMVSAEAKEAMYDKPAWSEEDSVMINKLLAVVGLYYNRIGDDLDKQSCISWLKSLRLQNRWKPSDKQMELLKEVQQALLGKDCHNRFVNFMYELKRLREE